MGAAFHTTLGAYSSHTTDAIVGRLTSAQSGFATLHGRQVIAWEKEIAILRDAVNTLLQRFDTSSDWALLLEYEIPRRDKRPDAVLLADDLVLVIEFKIGSDRFDTADEWQALSYALDLSDFHAASRDCRIVPILVATDAPVSREMEAPDQRDRLVWPVQRTNATGLAKRIGELHSSLHDPAKVRIDPEQWGRSAYRPTPTIIEAAEQLFGGHSVVDVSHAFATNLTKTSDALVNTIRKSQAEQARTICFVTGIPGAGKTLTGLNAVHDPSLRQQERPAGVFLSGNGPLVKIVCEALARDCQRRGMPKKKATSEARTFIAGVHRFITFYGIERTSEAPYENAIIFDEAQRAWNSRAVNKKHGIDKSEPELILEVMERAPGWCVVIALVGGGQEINTGEAGLEE